LVELWRLDLADAVLDRLALELGADVPVCRKGGVQLVSGIGEILRAAPPLPVMPLVLVNPGVPLKTADVFAALSGAGSPADPLDRAPADLADLGRMLGRRRNDLEIPARRLAPVLDAVLEKLAAQGGCLVARMSGSGASCFGLFADDASAAAALPRLGQAHPDWWLTQARIGDRAGRP
jgi:4-diphosphocytidyl-2-C-methyl-D-erythritol kinase